MLDTKIKFTYGEYVQLPEDKRYELIEGEFFMVPSPSWSHQTISASLFRAIDNYVRTHKLGEVRYAPLDVVLSEENVLQPDILFVSRERLDIITERNIQGAPDLVVEILDHGSRFKVHGWAGRGTAEPLNLEPRTRELYARYGVRECWLADPSARTIEVMSLADAGFESVGLYHEGAILRSPLLRGLSIEVRGVFSRVGHSV